jgi:N6-adenosine-specific RNA methylase IME4
MLYDVIYADPPWRYDVAPPISRDAIEVHYPTMSLSELQNLSIDNWAKPDCVLFLWSPAPKLIEALQLMASWNFIYRTCAVWDKERAGLGHWFRQQHELLLLGKRGNARCPKRRLVLPSVFVERKREHSRKPDCVRRAIEKMFPNAKRIELFARERHKGWDVWGLEAPSEYMPDQQRFWQNE